MLAAVMAMPLLLHGLGPARMGLFTLALGLFGFAGIFDLGLGRALTRSVANHLQMGTDIAQLTPLVRKGLLAVAAMGISWGLVILFGSERLLDQVPSLNQALRYEGLLGLRILAALIPVALMMTSLTGILEGFQQFGKSNSVRVPIGVATYLVPAIVAQFVPTLVAVIGALAAVRVAGTIALTILVGRQIPMRAVPNSSAVDAAPMWRYTGWLTISNIIGPLMVYGDRYYLATLLPPTAVGYYTVPLDTFFRATAVPGAALGAAFPALTDAQEDTHKARQFLDGAGALLWFVWLAPLVIAGLILPEVLQTWLGPAYSGQILGTSRLIIVGVLVNGFAQVPFTLLQAVGRPDVTAKLHMVELPLFALALTLLVGQFGIVGAALAWSLRVTLDAAGLFFMARRLFRYLGTSLLRQASTAAMGAAMILVACKIESMATRAGLALLLVLIAAFDLHRRGGISRLFETIRAAR